MPQLDKYLVSLGMKGQNVVLSTMKKIRAAGKDLTKKKIVPLSTKITSSAAAKTQSGVVPGAEIGMQREKQKQIGEKFTRAAEKFTGGVQNFASAAASLDPTATIESVTSALGTSLSGISVLGVSLGRLPEGIAAIANSTLSMAKNSVEMAKQATAAFYQLTVRNAAASHYGGRVTTGGPLSRNERAMFIDALSGSMGRIGQPLADEINKLIGKKDTRALARVGAGDWESTGTDKGWMLGQISSSFAGLPPSVRQKLQASLLKNFAGEIQDMAPGQADIQRGAAAWTDMEEKQTAALAAKAPAAIGMAGKMNALQLELYNTGIKFADIIDKTISTMATLPGEITKMKQSLKQFTDDPSMRNARTLIKSIQVGK